MNNFIAVMEFTGLVIIVGTAFAGVMAAAGMATAAIVDKAFNLIDRNKK